MSIEAATATNRFGMGAGAGDIERAGRDPRGWLLGQLEPRRTLSAEFKGLPSSTEIRAAHWHRYGEASPTLNRRLEALQAKGDAAAVEAASKDVQRMLGGYVMWATQVAHTEFAARTRHALGTDRPFEERLVRFWSNHLVVPTAKVPATILVGAYEREVIRPHAAGKFRDMLTASAKHAAMLTFLDNDTSIGPNSPFGRERKMGLNENLGREILELHTMGVDGGYTQADVIALATGLTGWSTAPAILRANTAYASALLLPQRAPDGPYAFAFYPDWHEPGPVKMLGKTYADEGVRQAETMLADLAKHPATARFLAQKFARHFVSDDPSESLVKRLADVYLAHDTSIGAMARALVESREAWTPEKRKLKQPEDFVISALRGVGAEVAALPPYPAYRFDTYRPPPGARLPSGDRVASAGGMVGGMAGGMEGGMAARDPAMADAAGEPRRRRRTATGGTTALVPSELYEELGKMGQKPFGAPGPQGWYDRVSDWSGAASLVKRIEWSAELAQSRANDLPEGPRMLDAMLGGSATAELRRAVERAATREQALTLILASAEFQRR
ncbi:MAG: DUF1800 family protein [Gammaproteobacteria bacterium]